MTNPLNLSDTPDVTQRSIQKIHLKNMALNKYNPIISNLRNSIVIKPKGLPIISNVKNSAQIRYRSMPLIRNTANSISIF